MPSVELTSELLFKLLTAEFASQRGNWRISYNTLMQSAQQTSDPRLAKRAMEIALSSRKMEEAENAVKLWRKLAPRSKEADQYYLSFVILKDNIAEAKPIIARSLSEATPASRSVLIFQVQRLLARAKDKTAAFATLEELLAPYSNVPETHIALAQGAFATGNLQRARAEAEAALKAKPDSELAALTMAQVLSDKTEALQSLSRFLQQNPDSRDVRTAYARMLVEQNRFSEARHAFEVLLEDQPQDLTSLYALGVLATQMNDYAAAEKYLLSYVNLLVANPEDERDPSQALSLLVQIAEERKDPGAAQKWLSQIESRDVYFSVQLKRAQLIAKRGNLAAAKKVLRDLKASEENEQVQVILTEAQILRDANKPQEAMTVMKAGVKRFPQNKEVLYDYALLAEKNNQFTLMESLLRRIIKIAPDNQHAYNALGYSLADRNIRLQEAYTLIEKALSLAPEDPFIMDSMGWVHYRLGRLQEAEQLLRKAYELRPDAEIAVHLGEVLWVKGQREDAQKVWRAVKIKDPQNDMLKSTLVRLKADL